MKIDGVVVDKNLPEYARGQIVNVDGRLLMLLHAKPRKVWPMWWNKLGRKIGWMWLARAKTKHNAFMA